MPSQVVVVLNEPDFAEQVSSAMQAEGYEAVAYSNSMAATNALELADRIELLITSPDIAPGQPNGISLALMTQMRRPGLKVLFLGLPEMEHYTAGVGELMPPSATVPEVVERAKAML